MGYYSSYLIYVLPALLIAMWASANVSSTFAKYSRVGNRRGYTGAAAARRILDENGLTHIRIERVSGKLSDHFDPRAQVVRLSDSTYDSVSVGAIGVAAHEVGHAIQHEQGYFPMKIRAAIIPLTQLGSKAAFPIAILGIVMSMDVLFEIGVFLFCAVVLFQLVTLPVEFNASRRAMKTLEFSGMLEGGELTGARKVLTAAALTYVAALITAVANLLRLLSMRDRRRNR